MGRGTAAACVLVPGLPEPAEIPFRAAGSRQHALLAEKALNYTADPRVKDGKCFSSLHRIWWGEDLAGLSKADFVSRLWPTDRSCPMHKKPAWEHVSPCSSLLSFSNWLSRDMVKAMVQQSGCLSGDSELANLMSKATSL